MEIINFDEVSDNRFKMVANTCTQLGLSQLQSEYIARYKERHLVSPCVVCKVSLQEQQLNLRSRSHLLTS